MFAVSNRKSTINRRRRGQRTTSTTGKIVPPPQHTLDDNSNHLNNTTCDNSNNNINRNVFTSPFMEEALPPITTITDNTLYDIDTKLLKFIFPTTYQKKTFMFLYDFFTIDTDGQYATGREHFTQILLQESSTLSNIADIVRREDVQQLIVDTSLESDSLKRYICSFPILRIAHESISTCPLALSQCTVNYTVLVLEVYISALYKQFIKNCRNRYLDITQNETVIADEDVFVGFKELWRNYIWTERYSTSEKGCDAFRRS